MTTHTHDSIDWSARVDLLRRADHIAGHARGEVARRLVSPLGQRPTVVDMGSGAGGMGAALARELHDHGGGSLVMVDAVPELLAAAEETARATLGDSDRVSVRTVLADLAGTGAVEQVPAADLVWASHVVHHLPDQRKGLDLMVRMLKPGGGRLALAEGGLMPRRLPWDLGLGTPGLEDRLQAAQRVWFQQMRDAIPGAVRMPIGWNRAMTDAGLTGVTAFSYLIDHPAPVSGMVLDAILDWVREVAEYDEVSSADKETISRLIDPGHPAYLGARDDLYLLIADTVHLGHT